MGCFVSTNKHYPSTKFNQHLSKSNRAPPPVVVDVETVKEVLSETPNLNRPFIKIEDDDHKKITSRQNSYKFRQQDRVLEDPNVSKITDGFSVFNQGKACAYRKSLLDPASEIDITMRESISTTFNDDIDVYRRKVIDKSPVKYRNRDQVSGELQPIGKSPVRGKEQSPGRVRLVPETNCRGTGFGSAGRQRPASGNVSTARSRSPANRTVPVGGSADRNEVGRSLSGRRIGKSPCRVGSDLQERVRKPDLRSGRERELSRRFQTAVKNDESLENPLVSLECFIFL